MSQTKTPPWERSCSELTAIEKALFHHFDGFPEQSVAAWSELCALQAVAETAELAIQIDLDLNSFCLCDECDEGETCVQCRLRAALKEWRAICPK